MRDSLVDDPTVCFREGESATWAEKGMFLSAMWFPPCRRYNNWVMIRVNNWVMIRVKSRKTEAMSFGM